jgi:cytochrome b6-f complex iron-sulfur subunit
MTTTQRMSLQGMMDRRRFLSLCGGLIAGALVASCVQKGEKPEVDRVSLQAEEIPLPGADPIHSDSGAFYLINNDDGLLALYTRCTHQGCTVEWQGDDQRFKCPCHGSQFDRHGIRVEGPAERPLDLMAIQRQPNGLIQVDTTALTERKQ